jgi:Fur family zinc uptake transcriptional regulator
MSEEIEALLDCAQAVCARNGAQLTPLRRTVLGLVIASDRPTGAYDLLQRLAETQGRAARPVGPPTVYRALEFLIGEGLIHKVERLSAYVACTHHLRHDHAHPAHDQAIQFLICRQCGRADELEDGNVRAALGEAASRSGFRLTAATIEAEGLCAACDAAGAA